MKKKYTNRQLEFALDLKPGSIEKDKNKPEMKSLMKIIKEFPWLVEVADRNFDPDFAKATIIKEGASILGKLSTDEILDISNFTKSV